MKSSFILFVIAVVSAFSTLSYGAVIKVVEYEDRVVVEIDGSMDPRLASQNGAQAVTVKAQSQLVESKSVVPLTNKEVPTAKTGADDNAITANKQSPLSTNVTIARTTQSDLPVPSKYPAYNRAEQIMAYMEKLPKRNDFVEGRLEARQTRWNKKLSRNSGDNNQ